MAVIAEVALRGTPEVHFEELYASCQPRVYRTCLAILRNADDAAEATQEVFSRALPLVTQLREPQLWLQTVARNYCLDQLRRQKVRGSGTLDDDHPGKDDPEREALLRDALRQAFHALSPRERRALGRVLLMDDSLGDIAGMLGISYGAAAQVVSRARRRAALAARAVIGASLAWLTRLSLPRERSSRAGRAVAQALESGQNIVLAAAVVLTAGTVAHNAGGASAAMPPSTGSSGVAVTAAPALVAAPAAASAPAGVAAVATVVHALSPLPAGYLPGPITATTPARSAPPPGSPQSPSTQGFKVTLEPQTTPTCAGATVGVSRPDGTPLGSKTVQVCQP